MFWLGSATLVARLLDVFTSIAVLRLLTGAELGAATLVLSVMTFVEGWNSLGINNVIIQRAQLSEDELASAWWYVLGVAVAMTSGMMLAAPLFADLYGASELTPLIRLLSLKLLFVGLASIPLALLHRALRFREVGAIMAGAAVLSSLFAVVLAFRGAGALAPVAGSAVHGLLQLVGACLLNFYRPRARFAWAHIAQMAREGVQLAGAVSIGQLTRNIDYLVLGRFVSLGVLGAYRAAFDLAMSPSFVVLQVVNRASLPIYSRIAGDGGSLSPAFARTLRIVALLIIPALLLAVLQGETLFALLDKTHGGDIGLVIACLCGAAWLRGLSQCTPVLLIAARKPTRALVQALSTAGLLTVGLLAGLNLWPESDPLLVTACVWITSSALQLGVDFWLARTSVTLRLPEWLNAVLVPAGVGLLTLGAAFAVHRLAGVAATVPALVIDALAIVAVFALVLRFGLKMRPSELRPKLSG